jgi:hypothetical protein
MRIKLTSNPPASNTKKINKPKVVWIVDEEIIKGAKSVPRYINDLPDQNPLTIKITGYIVHPVFENLNGAYPTPDPNVTLQVFINDQTNQLWNINFLHENEALNHLASKIITLQRPESGKMKIEFLFANLPAFNDYDRYKNAILKKGFKIELIN